jgi:FkbM family methyltransferase
MFRIAAAIVVLLGLVPALYPPARLGLWVLIGRGTNCEFGQAIRSQDGLLEQTRFKDEILAASKLLETDPAGYKLCQTPMGHYWIPNGSEFVLSFNLAEVRREIYFRQEHTIRPGDVVLDCGANVGVFTRKALDMGASQVIAIEPGPENVECLRRNFAPEIASGRVRLVPKGVWSTIDTLEFHVDPENSAADSFLINRPGSRMVRVPVTTIDSLVRELALDRVDFIKMDIEGAELEALDGGAAVIRERKPKISISAYHHGDHPVQIPARIRTLRADYVMTCGPCAEIGFGVRPDILYFQ